MESFRPIELGAFKTMTNLARKKLWIDYPRKAKRYNNISKMFELIVSNRDGYQIFIPLDYCATDRITDLELCELGRTI